RDENRFRHWSSAAVRLRPGPDRTELVNRIAYGLPGGSRSRSVSTPVIFSSPLSVAAVMPGATAALAALKERSVFCAFASGLGWFAYFSVTPHANNESMVRLQGTKNCLEWREEHSELSDM